MKRNNLFERLLVLSCEACEVPVANAMSKTRSADAVDCRLMAVDLMLKYGLSDVFEDEDYPCKEKVLKYFN